MGKIKAPAKQVNMMLRQENQKLMESLEEAGGKDLRLSDLRAETQFLKYVELLRRFASRYTVAIVSYDTPCGPTFTPEVSEAFRSIGLKEDLCGKYRLAYAAVIDSGILLFEKLAADPLDRADFEVQLNGIHLSVGGSGLHSSRRGSWIQLDGKNAMSAPRGLSIFVFDKVTGASLDAVTFDTFSPGFPCKRLDKLKLVTEKLIKERGVTVVSWGKIPFPSGNATRNEAYIVEHGLMRGMILADLQNCPCALRRYYDVDGLANVLAVPESYHDVNGVRRFKDYQSRYMNTQGGHRITANQPAKAKHTIFFVGECFVFGVGSEDRHTIESHFQEILNRDFPEGGYVVQNYGYYLAEADSTSNEIPAIMDALPVKPGDIVMINASNVLPDIPFISTAQPLPEGRDFDIYWDMLHFTPDGNRLMAEALFKGLMEKNLLTAGNAASDLQGIPGTDYGFDQTQSKELNEYKAILRDYYNEMFSVTIGAVVMNCNPFTYGHRYLIEKALEQCDFLVIFVVQEDKSVFPFEERLAMVDEGTADISNKVVIPSGQFIISSLTFSEYFNKSEIQDMTIDTSLDVTVFAKEIAPCLHITKRFAGEEPNDQVTRQYNEAMARILPEYGIEFIEIARKETDGRPVSASEVRKLMEQGKLDEVRELVPETTMHVLQKRLQQ